VTRRASACLFPSILISGLLKILDDAIRRIFLVESAAGGNMGPESDLNQLIAIPDGNHRHRTSVEIFKALGENGLPKDVIVVNKQDVSLHRSNPFLVLKPALDEGREIYDVA
jgi:hypothetical protein